MRSPDASGEVHKRVIDAASAPPARCKLLLTAAGASMALGPPGAIGPWLAPDVLATDMAVAQGDPCDFGAQLPLQPVQLQASAGIEWT